LLFQLYGNCVVQIVTLVVLLLVLFTVSASVATESQFAALVSVTL
jgi:hypothetical protein